ncbi:TPA: ImmA/IrrE family metallo-endopeptidase [Streptococcus agalactiae]|nr:ImmA/IrrE family metallo-endopeptidase [Streptococcus agalactiae]
MTIEEIIDYHKVNLAYFDNELWPRPGIYIDDIKVIFVNKSLSLDAQKRVILHELGHCEKNIGDYKTLREKQELEADRYMIGHLVAEALNQLEDKREFNYLQFMKYHQLTTTADECMVIDEYYNLLDAV